MNQPNTQRPCSYQCTHTLRQCLFGLALLAVGALASCAQAQARYSYSTDGLEVTDSKTGLTWQRCSAGQIWAASTCTGTATTYTHEGALSYAKTKTGWRLPNVKELHSITDKTRNSPAIDVTAFPSTLSNWYWSASPFSGISILAWSVDFNYGEVHSGYGRLESHQVRLVR